MTPGKTLKYVRTVQGFMVFPCRAAIHKDVAGVAVSGKISAGFIDWDFDGRPFCHGRSDSMELASRPEDTAELRAEWGMTAPASSALAFADPQTFSSGLPDLPNRTQEGV